MANPASRRFQSSTQSLPGLLPESSPPKRQPKKTKETKDQSMTSETDTIQAPSLPLGSSQEDPPMTEQATIEDLSDLLESQEEKQEESQEEPTPSATPSATPPIEPAPPIEPWDGTFLAVQAGRCIETSDQQSTFSCLILPSPLDLSKLDQKIRGVLVFLGSTMIEGKTVFVYTTRLAQSKPEHLAKKLGSSLPKSYWENAKKAAEKKALEETAKKQEATKIKKEREDLLITLRILKKAGQSFAIAKTVDPLLTEEVWKTL